MFSACVGTVRSPSLPGWLARAVFLRSARGDRIFIVDGQPAEKLSSAEVRRLLDERRELVLVLRRGDQQVEVRVPVIDLVPEGALQEPRQSTVSKAMNGDGLI